MGSTALFNVSKSDLCSGCHASAQFHLRNPFGVYYIGVPGHGPISYYEWHNKPVTRNVILCPEYVNLGVTLDHDALFRALARI